MLSRELIHRLAVGLLLIGGCAMATVPFTRAQEAEPSQPQITRKLKNRLTPSYPDLARRMNIAGVVKVQVTIDKTGTIKNTKLVGGHPILAGAAMDALRKWRYEPGPEETTGIVEFRFDPLQ